MEQLLPTTSAPCKHATTKHLLHGSPLPSMGQEAGEGPHQLGRLVLGGLYSQWLLVGIMRAQHRVGSSMHTFTKGVEASRWVCKHQHWLRQPCPAAL